MLASQLYQSGQRVERTVIRSHEFINPVVRLPTLNSLLAIECATWKLIWPVHPINTGIDMMLVAGTDLQNASNPVVIGSTLSDNLIAFWVALLSVDGGLVRYINETFAVVLDTVHCGSIY